MKLYYVNKVKQNTILRTLSKPLYYLKYIKITTLIIEIKIFYPII
jgi:hypothetical protein